jgi:Leucine-rich repeat (LRR) protein
MKKLLLVLLALPLIGFGQNVNIPDVNFKAYLVNNTAINTNGDAQISVTEAAAFNGTINCEIMDITNLTGIEAFTALTELLCNNNLLDSLNVSQNTALTSLYCNSNQLTRLDVSQNTALTDLDCQYNELSSLDVSQNTALTYLSCESNQLTSLDISKNTDLNYLKCVDNQLTSLDVRNGNNTNFTYFKTTNNPNLYCIDVDDATWSTANWTVANYSIDSQSYFSNNCGSK